MVYVVGCNGKSQSIMAGLMFYILYNKGTLRSSSVFIYYSHIWTVWNKSSTTVGYNVGPGRKCCEGAMRASLGNRVGNLA